MVKKTDIIHTGHIVYFFFLCKVGELFEELLDVSLSVSEECLHLSVSTPLDPTNGKH